MKILKKFDSYIKEDLDAMAAEPATKPAPSTTPAPATPTVEPGTKPERRERPTPIRRDRPAVEPDPQAKMKMDATEEEGTYIGAEMLQDLADALGTEVIDNAVEYEGKKVNFYSETEKFHVDKKKFATVQEVVDYLTGGQPSHSEKIEKMEDQLDEMSDEVEELEAELEEEDEEEEIGRTPRKFIDDFEEFDDSDDDFNELFGEDEMQDEDDFGDEYQGEDEEDFHAGYDADDDEEEYMEEDEDEMSRRFMEEDDEHFDDGFEEGEGPCPNCECEPCECSHDEFEEEKDMCAKCQCNPCKCDDTELRKNFQGFTMKDDRIKWPREEEAMESRITKRFNEFK